MTDFNIGVLPGGRVLPGMQFREDHVPFSAPIVISEPHISTASQMDIDSNRGYEDQSNEVRGEGIQGSQTGGGLQEGLNIPGTTVPENNQPPQTFRRAYEPGESSRMGQMRGRSRSRAGNAGLGRSYPFQNEIDINPYIGLDHDELTYVPDYDLLIQESINDRVDGNGDRTRLLDDQRGYYQAFTVSNPLHLFYNEPPSPPQEDMEINNENGQENHNQDIDMVHANNEGSDTVSSGTTQERPAEGWNSGGEEMEGSETGSPIDVAGLFNNSDYDSGDQLLDVNELLGGQNHQLEEDENNNATQVLPSFEDFVPEEPQWNILASATIGNYEHNQGTVSDSGVVNAIPEVADFWRRINKMPRFKRRGVARRRGKRAIKTHQALYLPYPYRGGKRKAESDPGQEQTGQDPTDSDNENQAASRLLSHKRFCQEGREWVRSLGMEEGQSSKAGRGEGMMKFKVVYENDNKEYEESMVGSSSNTEQEKTVSPDSKTDDGGFAGVDQEQPSRGP